MRKRGGSLGNNLNYCTVESRGSSSYSDGYTGLRIVRTV